MSIRKRIFVVEFAVLMALGAVLSGNVCGADNSVPTDDDLMLSPLQNKDLFVKAWCTKVTADFKNTDLRSVLAQWSKESGVEIQLDPSFQYSPYSGHASSSSMNVSQVRRIGSVMAARAQKFMRPDEIEKLSDKSFDTFFKGDIGITSLTAPPAPLALMLHMLPQCDVSYRKNVIFVSDRKTLLPELITAHTVKLAHPWGSIYRVNRNGEWLEFRLNLLDTYAKELLEQCVITFEPNPIGSLQRLKALDLGMDVKFDPDSKTLTITGHPDDISYVMQSTERFDVESPDEKAEQLGQEAWNAATDARRAELRKLVQGLDADEFDTRQTAETKLVAAGPIGMMPLSEKIAPDSQEFRDRQQRIRQAIIMALYKKDATARGQ